MYSGLPAMKNERFCRIFGETVLLRDIISLEGGTCNSQSVFQIVFQLHYDYIPPMGLLG